MRKDILKTIYLKAKSTQIILEVTKTESLTLKCRANIDILVPKPSCIVGDGHGLDFTLRLNNNHVFSF